MPSTPTHGLPYPGPSDTPDVPYWNQQLAEAVEAKMQGQSSGSSKRSHIQTYASGGTTDASGFLTVSHTAGFVPRVVYVVNTNPGGSFAAYYGFDASVTTSSSVKLRFQHASTTGTYNSAATGAFTIMFWE